MAGITRADLKLEMDKLRDTIDRRMVPMKAEQEKHHKTLYGNGEGRMGMDEQIRNINAWIEEQKRVSAKRGVWWDKLQWVVIPIGVSGFLAFVYQAFVFFTQIAPILEGLKTGK